MTSPDGACAKMPSAEDGKAPGRGRAKIDVNNGLSHGQIALGKRLLAQDPVGQNDVVQSAQLVRHGGQCRWNRCRREIDIERLDLGRSSHPQISRDVRQAPDIAPSEAKDRALTGIKPAPVACAIPDPAPKIRTRRGRSVVISSSGARMWRTFQGQCEF
jgi:hypothetical protein